MRDVVLFLMSLTRSCAPVGDAMDSAGPESADPSEIEVTSSDLGGWTNSRDVAGDGGPCADLPRAGAGSLCLAIEGPTDEVSPAYTWTLESELGLLADLDAASVDFYRSASSEAYGHFAPAVWLHVLEPSTGETTWLIWEATYNGYASYTDSVTEDLWFSDEIGSDYWWKYDWSVIEIYNRTPADWGYSADARVVGVSLGLGSGWNASWAGAADLLSLRFAGVMTTWNFEP